MAGINRSFAKPGIVRPMARNALERRYASEILGPELAPLLTSGASWVAQGTGAVYDGTKAVFTASSSTAVVEVTGVTALNDNTLYKVEVDVASYVQGQVRVQVYGDTTAHLGTAGPYSENGTFVAYVRTENAGTNTNRIRIQSNGPSTPGNTLNVTRVSVREVLAL